MTSAGVLKEEQEDDAVTTVTSFDHTSFPEDNELSQYCRLCASAHGNLLPIFGPEGEQLDIAEKMSRCLPIIVYPMDSLPQNICVRCFNKLNISYRLITSALKTEAKLKAKFLPSLWNECGYQKVDNSENDSIKEEGMEIKQEYDSSEEDINPAVHAEVILPSSVSKTDMELKLLNGKIQTETKVCEDIKNEIKQEIKRNVELKGEGMVDGTEKDAFFNEAALESCDEVKNAENTSINIYGPTTCDICNVTYTDMDKFDEHVSCEHLMKWQCRLCDDSFEDSAELLAHKVVEHSNDLISCERCGLEDVEEDDDEEMVEEWLDETQCNKEESQAESDPEFNISECELKENTVVIKTEEITCEICGIECSSHKGLAYHKQQKHSKDESHVCNHCDKSFDGRLPLIIHKKHQCQFGRKSYECNICDRTFFRETSLHLHLKAHIQGKKQYNCDCGETFEWFDAYQEHKKNHKQLVSLECVTCHKVFTNETFYKRHRYIHDPEYWDRFKCQTCKRPFRDAQALSNHMQLHTGSKPHKCDLCGRTYNRYANMMKHRKLHKPPNLWEHKCNQCEAKYERLKDLMSHIERTHTTGEAGVNTDANIKEGGKVFKWICRFCGKRISTKLSLQDHERIHTGLKPYICEWCGREFRSRPNLLQHHLTHTGDRKHACDICGKKFARKSFITQHMRVHTGEKPFECNICGHRFTQAGDMRRHRRRHVEIKVEADYIVDLQTDDRSYVLKVNA